MKHLRTCHYLFFIIVASALAPFLFTKGVAAYANNNLPSGSIPNWVFAPQPGNGTRTTPHYQGRCTAPGPINYSVAQNSWISTRNGTNFATTGATVPYGTTSVSLNVVINNNLCFRTFNGDGSLGPFNVINTWHRVQSVSATGGATVSGIANNTIVSVGYPTYANRHSSVAVNALPITINIPANLAPGQHTFSVQLNNVARINLFQNGVYQCVQSGGNRTGVTLGQFVGCAQGLSSLPFIITVQPPNSYNNIASLTRNTPNSATVFPGDEVTVNTRVRNIGPVASVPGQAQVIYNQVSTAPATGPALNYIEVPQDNCGNAPPIFSTPITAPSATALTPTGAGDPHFCFGGTYAGGPRNRWIFPFGALVPNTPAAGVSIGTFKFRVRSDSPPGTFCMTVYLVPGTPITNFAWDQFNPAGGRLCYTVGVAPPVKEKPYFIVKNGDIAAGVGNAVNTVCNDGWTGASGTENILRAWNNDVGPTYHGASTNLASFAVGLIDQFASASSRYAPSATSVNSPMPSSLSFANTTGDYGGGYTGGIPCPTNYFSQNTLTSADWSGTEGVPTNADGIHYADSNLEISGTNGGLDIGLGYRQDVFVDGDVYISGNITLAGGATTIEDLPNFRLIVRGNIYIASGVTRLDGLYVAQPSVAGTKGYIYTCSNAAGSGPPLSSDLFGSGPCTANKLTVNGAFVAKEVKLYRSQGNADDLSSGPAEEFNLTPGTWLAAPNSMSAGSTGRQYDAFTSLPPVL